MCINHIGKAVQKEKELTDKKVTLIINNVSVLEAQKIAEYVKSLRLNQKTATTAT